MADLLQNYGGQIAQAASIPGAQANQWATAGLTQQQSQAAALQNQITQMKMPFIQGLIQRMTARQQQQQDMQANSPEQDAGVPGITGPTNVPPPSTQSQQSPTPQYQPPTTGQPTATQTAPQVVPQTPAPPAGQGSSLGAASIPDTERAAKMKTATDGWATKAFQPSSTAMNTQTVQDYQDGLTAASLGIVGPEYAQGIQANWEAPIIRANQQKLIDANKAYSLASDVDSQSGTTADGISHAWMVLHQQNPQMAATIDPHKPEAQIKELANSMGNSAFRYTGRPAIVQGDQFYDASTGKPVLGDNRIPFTNAQLATEMDAANKETHVIINGRDEAGPAWYMLTHADGYKGPQYVGPGAYARAQLEAAANIGATQPNGMPGAATTPATGSAAAPPKVPVTSSTTVPVTGAASQSPTVTAAGTGAAQQNTGPVEGNLIQPSNNARGGAIDLSKIQGFQNPTPKGFGGSTPIEQANAAIIPKAQYDGDTEMADLSTAAQGQITRAKQAMQVLPSAATGTYSGFVAKVQAFVQKFGVNPTPKQIKNDFFGDPSNYFELMKFLNQGAISDLENNVTTSGEGSARFSGLLAQLATKEMAPNSEMPRRAIEDMLKYNVAASTYNINKVDDYNKYKASDPQLYNPQSFKAYYNTNPDTQQANVINRLTKNMDNFGNLDTELNGHPELLHPGETTYKGLRYIGKDTSQASARNHANWVPIDPMTGR